MRQEVQYQGRWWRVTAQRPTYLVIERRGYSLFVARSAITDTRTLPQHKPICRRCGRRHRSYEWCGGTR